MPYPRYGGNDNRRDRRDDHYHNQGELNPWQGGFPMNRNSGGGRGPGGLLPTPGQNELALANNILGTLMSSGGLASSLAMATALQGGSGHMSGQSSMGSFNNRGVMDRGRDRDMRSRGGRDRSPVRRNFSRRSRSRSRDRGRRSDYDNRRKRTRAGSPKDRAPHEIYIGNYPVKFREADVRKLFEENSVKVTTIRLKHDGLKVFAFAETTSEEEIQKAIKSMDSKEIMGRRLRVRSSADKDRPNVPAAGGSSGSNVSQSKPPAPAKKLKEEHVTRHLAYAFVTFLDRQMEKEECNDVKKDAMSSAKNLIINAFDLPEDDTLKVSRNLELIFMQNNRREIKPPEDDKKEEEDNEEGNHVEGTGNDDTNDKEAEDDDDGNWKRRKVAAEDDDDAEVESKEEAPKEDEEEANVEEEEEEAKVEEENDEKSMEELAKAEEKTDEQEQPEPEEEEEQEEDVLMEQLGGAIESLEQEADEEQQPEKEVETPDVVEVEDEEIVQVTPTTKSPGRGRGRARRSRGRRP